VSGELMKNPGRDVNHLSSRDCLTLGTEAHFSGAFDDKIHLLLLLVVPWNLPAFGVQRDISHAEVFCLNGSCSSGEVLGSASGGIPPAFDLREIRDDHWESFLFSVFQKSGRAASEKGVVGFVFDDALEIEGQFTGVVITHIEDSPRGILLPSGIWSQPLGRW